MRLLAPAGAALLLGFLLVAPVGAAPAGRIEGVILNGATGDPQRGVEVILSIGSQAERGLESRRATTRADGTYVFDDLPTGEDTIYVVDARYDGGIFPGSPLTLPADTAEKPVFETRIRVWETTTDPGAILVKRDSIVLVPDNGHLGVIESITVENVSERAYIGRGGADQQPARTLGLPLPAGATDDGVSIVESTLDVPELVPTDFGIALTVAIPPGETRIAYSYRVGGIAGTYDLARRALYPTVRTTVLAADPITIESPRFEPGDDVELAGTTYSTWNAASTVPAGDPIPITAVAEAGVGPALVAGGAAAATTLAGLGLFALLRGRRKHAVTRSSPAAARVDLIETIAALDLALESGDIDKDEWMEQRQELKARLEEMEIPERAG